ncbi:MAG: hypothetical protein CL504_09550 [Actinobacteria bacterium]|nr:hypothetical protein [Actinomycetota bacterium]
MKFLDFTDHVRQECQGVPGFMVERAVRDAAIEFCKRTGVYIPEAEEIVIYAGVNDYELSLPSGTELNYITDIFANKTRLKPVSYPELLHKIGDGIERATPAYYSQRDNNSFFLAPIPAVKDTIRVLFSLKPSSTATSIPDTIGKEHREAITEGALFRLQMMPNQPFTNPNLAAAKKQLFDREIGKTVRQVKFGFSGGNITIRKREFI